VDVGDKLRLSTAAGAGATTTLRIAGLFDLGNRGANARNVFVALHTGQSLLALPGGVTSLDVAVNDVYTAEAIAQRITAATGVEANSWIRTNAELFTAISAQNTSNTAIRFFVGLSVAFGIASVLAVVVVQKSREIGILRAMGISQGQVLRLFLLQGGLLGLAGDLATLGAHGGRFAPVRAGAGAVAVRSGAGAGDGHRAGGGVRACPAGGAAGPGGGHRWLSRRQTPAPPWSCS